MTVQTKTHLWWTWLQIAARATASAMHSRVDGYPPQKFESGESAKLSAEFQFSLVAVAACAFALEALSKEIEGSGYKVDSSRFKKPATTNAGFFVAQRIIQAFALSGPAADSWPGRLESLFRLRNDSVHFESVWRSGVHPHPSGVRTGYELSIFTLEAAVESVRLGLDVIRECAAAAIAGRNDRLVVDAANEMPGVLAMFEETLRAHGLEEVL